MAKGDSMSAKTQITKLARSCWATGIHGVTGQEVDEGTLAAGTLARNVVTRRDDLGPVTRFEASTDGGETWYLHETHAEPKDLFVLAGPIELVRTTEGDLVATNKGEV